MHGHATSSMGYKRIKAVTSQDGERGFQHCDYHTGWVARAQMHQQCMPQNTAERPMASTCCIRASADCTQNFASTANRDATASRVIQMLATGLHTCCRSGGGAAPWREYCSFQSGMSMYVASLSYNRPPSADIGAYTLRSCRHKSKTFVACLIVSAHVTYVCAQCR